MAVYLGVNGLPTAFGHLSHPSPVPRIHTQDREAFATDFQWHQLPHWDSNRGLDARQS